MIALRQPHTIRNACHQLHSPVHATSRSSNVFRAVVVTWLTLVSAAQVINSRLAMLGFVAAIGAELSTHTGVLQQFQKAPLSIEATFLIFTGEPW